MIYLQLSVIILLRTCHRRLVCVGVCVCVCVFVRQFLNLKRLLTAKFYSFSIVIHVWSAFSTFYDISCVFNNNNSLFFVARVFLRNYTFIYYHSTIYMLICPLTTLSKIKLEFMIINFNTYITVCSHTLHSLVLLSCEFLLVCTNENCGIRTVYRPVLDTSFLTPMLHS